MERINTIGRRKTSVARIYLSPGKGEITVNDRGIQEYFPLEILRTVINQPFEVTDPSVKYDVSINVKGGGFKGQAEAIRLAISRALVLVNEESKPALRKEGFMTRDSRMVERKKYGKKKARRSFQWTKR
ncbi:MAG: 30S ribosomal protein S9 [Cytophagales bacterium]|nr:30S ribosomal protein S9 [Cytophagales bacterium]